MLTVDVVAQQLVNAVTLSAIYALIALGFSLFFGAIGIVNFAHGDVAMIGAFAALAAFRAASSHVDPAGYAFVGAATVLFGMLASAGVGLGLDRLAFRPLRASPPLVGLLASVGAGFVIRESVLNFFPDGRNPQPFPSLISESSHELFDVIVLDKQVFIVGISILLVVALALLIERTRFGRAMRSVVNNREVARLLGVRVDRIVAKTFFLGSALAGIAGVLNAIYYNIIQFDMGLFLAVKGFTAAVIGGLGNVYGALAGAFIVGMVEAFTAGFIPGGSAYKDIAVFASLTVILIFSPEGIVGRRRLK